MIVDSYFPGTTSGIVNQQDGATPHTGYAFVELINQYISGNSTGTALSFPSALRALI
jgi:hypothetical protein